MIISRRLLNPGVIARDITAQYVRLLNLSVVPDVHWVEAFLSDDVL
jgi:hypothetical protein